MNSKWHWPTASRITDISWQIVPGYLQINLTRTLWGVMIRSNCKNVTTRRNDLQPRRAPLGAKEYKTNCGNKQDTWTTHGLKKILWRVFLHPGVFFVCSLGIFYLWEDRKRQYSGLVFQNNQIQTYIKLKLITLTRLVSSSCPSLLREGTVDFQLVPCRLQFSWKVKRQISKYFCECIHKTCLSEINDQQVMVMFCAWRSRHNPDVLACVVRAFKISVTQQNEWKNNNNNNSELAVTVR